MRAGLRYSLMGFQTKSERGNGRGNYSELPTHKTPRVRGYVFVIVNKFLVAGAHNRRQLPGPFCLI